MAARAGRSARLPDRSVGASGVLLLVAVVASLGSAWRAGRVDPGEALRAQ